MIKANELRIGNWVVFNHQKKPYNKQVNAEMIADADLDKKLLSSIPLTPEILEKAGFEKFNKTEHLTSYAIKIDDDYELLITVGQQYPFIEFAEWQKQDASFKYLHQLQNLYFALTGTELEINL